MKGRWRIDDLMGGVRRLAAPLSGRTGRSARRQRELVEIVRGSPLFDAAWYLRTYPDVAEAKIDPASHFVATGWREGRNPGPDFTTWRYLKANPDVARTGTNPLVHFIEFGEFEGRDIAPPRKQERPAAMPAQQSFARPAPVYRGEIAEREPAPWTRSYRLSRDEKNLIRVGDSPIGLAVDRQGVEADFARLRRLSGLDNDGSQPDYGDQPDEVSHELIDAWHAGGGLLRTRWRAAEHPFVVRAYQHQPTDEGWLALVAESLAESPLDFIDTHFGDPYFPILFVFTDPHNFVQATRLIAFPSLCRGGLHYAELVASGSGPDGAWPDPIRFGLDRACALEDIRRSGSGHIRRIAIEPGEDPCTGPLFQPDFQRWLVQVAGVSISGLATDDSIPGPQAGLRCAGGTLALAPDMVPTIGALTAAGAGEITGSAAFAPLLVASPDPSKPSLLVEVPADAPESIGDCAPGSPSAWPRTESSVAAGLEGPAAIRFTSDAALSDAELLAPAMLLPATLPQAEKASVCWVICAADWREDELLEAIEALSVQTFTGNCSIAFAGAPSIGAHELAKRLFGGRASSHGDLAGAARETQAAFVGYLGPGVILHDGRTTDHFVRMLADNMVSSVSCALLTSEKKGKTVHVTISDAGTVGVAQAGHRVDLAELAHTMWRACYPVKRPARDLWLARADEARSWLADNQPLRYDGVHLNTTFVTASYSRHRSVEGLLGAVPPPVPDSSALRAGSYFG